MAVQGMIQRRLKQRAAALGSFDQAIAIFDSLGASIWADRARAEHGQASGRRVSSWELTSAEDRVARLVTAGRTNSQIAAALFVSLKTVEVNLTRIYRKLGIRSRTELAVWMERRDADRSGPGSDIAS
jgi:DNA-binding NarL/FixJ family response regulator